jgi:thiol-disulfide isomerase/thioredoxin
MTKYILFVIVFVFCQNGVTKASFNSEKAYGDTTLDKWLGKKFPISSLRTIKGDTLNLLALRKSSYCFNFWALECGPCRFELGDLNSFSKEIKEDVGFFSFCDNDPAEINKFLLSTKIDFPIVASDQFRLDTTLIAALPTTIFCDSNLVIKKIVQGVSVKKVNNEWVSKTKEVFLKILDTFYK